MDIAVRRAPIMQAEDAARRISLMRNLVNRFCAADANQ